MSITLGFQANTSIISLFSQYEQSIVLRRSGLLLAFATVCLQLAVFLQPLLPEQYQIAPVCELITLSLFASSRIQSIDQNNNHTEHLNSDRSAKARAIHLDQHADSSVLDVKNNYYHQHDANHQCPYCTFYGHLTMPPELGVKEILFRIQVRLLAFSNNFQHVYFQLQRLYLIPQGRAPPSSI